MRQEASVGGILRELSSLVVDARLALGLYTLVIGGLTAIGVVTGLTETVAGTVSFGVEVDASDTPATALFDIVLAIASIVGTYWLLTCYLAARGRLGDGGNRFWPYLGMSILSAIGVVFGLVLLIVPGVILIVRWSAASGFLIGAGESVTGSLTASWNATKGHGWAIFLAALVLFVGVIAMAAIVAAMFGMGGAMAGDVASAFLETVAGALFAGFGIAVFGLVDDRQRLDEVFA